MSVLYFLVPIALALATAAVFAFRWAVRHEQFDDLDAPAVRVLDENAPITRD
jgi:cbb3-type cytochrome oxidase maturation protein